VVPYSGTSGRLAERDDELRTLSAARADARKQRIAETTGSSACGDPALAQLRPLHLRPVCL